MRFYLFVVFIFINFGCTPQKKTLNTARPNIIFILADDQRNDVLGCAGHPVVQTPTIDKLAVKGIRFTNAFVTTSICAASRASILTGLYEAKHNYTFGKDPLKTELINTSYPYLLRQAGYKTGFIGKLGVKMEGQDTLLGKMFDYYQLSPRSTPHFETMPDGSQRHSAEIKGDQAIEFINEQSSSQPFCLSLSFNAVHAVDGNLTPGNEGHYPYPAAVADLYAGMKMPPPKLADPEIFDNHPDFLKNSLNRSRYFWRWDTEEKYQTNLRAYFRMISGYDKVMKRVLAALEAKDLDKNTLIIYSADNGYYMGNRGFAGKWSHYEESLRVPMVIYDPRAPKQNAPSTSEDVILNIDIPATILDYAQIEQPDIYQGESMAPLIKGEEKKDWREGFLFEHRMDHPQIPKVVGYRGQRFVYANYYEQASSGFEFLHDLQKDPDQLENLKNHQQYREALMKIRALCFQMEEELSN